MGGFFDRRPILHGGFKVRWDVFLLLSVQKVSKWTLAEPLADAVYCRQEHLAKKKKVYLESEVYYMKTRKIRLLSALLALAMLLALLPTAAFAETSGDYQYSVDSDGKVTITRYIGSGRNVVIPDKIEGHPVTAIGKSAFQNSGLTAVDMSGADHLEIIGEMAFLTCKSLNRVDFPQNGVLKTIGEGAFSTGDVNGATFEKLYIPASVETIGNRAFGKCSKLETVTFAPESKLKEIGSVAFFNTALESITIPEKVTTIGSGAFEGCSKLKKVTFAPDSKLETIGNNAFGSCHKDLIICYSNETVKNVLSNVVSPDKIKPTKPTVTFDFDNGSEVKTEKVENGKTISKPETDPTRAGWNFVGWYTKDDNDKYELFDFNTPITDNMTLYARWIPGGTCGAKGNENDVIWALDDNGTLTISGSGAMADYNSPNSQPWANRRSSIKKVVIGDKVTSIGENAFANCPGLKAVELPKDGVLETIKYNAFSWLYLNSEVGAGITEITIPKSVKTIETYAFDGCTRLATVTFAPNSMLETIGSKAFRDTDISEISIPASVKKIDSRVFNGCLKLTKVIFESPSKLDTVDENAFSGCDNLQTVYYDGNNDGVKQSLQSQLGEKFKNDWTVKFETEGGSAVAQQNVKNGETATKPTDPTKEGYKFGGWYDGDTKFDFDTPITKDTTLTAQWQLPEAPVTYKLTVTDGTAWVNGEQVTEAAKGDVVTIEASETALEGMTFERWEVRKGNVKLENDRAAKTSFTMPDGMVQLEAMYQAADVEDSGWDAATVVTGVAVGTGTAILAYHIGMEVYAEQVLGKDVAVPRTRSEVALLAWQLAGSPAVHVEGEPLSEAAQAERWAVESGLMQPDAEGNFNGTKKMSKWNALRTLDAAKKMG